jgi:hypothetical protein
MKRWLACFVLILLAAGFLGVFSGDEKAMEMCQERHSPDVCFDMIYN